MSGSSVPRGDIPQGNKLDPLLFAILVNNLARDCNIRAKYVDMSVVEVIPKCSPSVLPLIANDICRYFRERGMCLNPTKCKEMFVDFSQFKPVTSPPMQLPSAVIKRAASYKLLGVHVLESLSCNVHCDYIVQRARKPGIYAIRIHKKPGV